MEAAKLAGMAQRRQSRVLIQAAILGGALALIAGALWHARSQPFDADTLQIQEDALQSQSAELDAVASLARGGTLDPRWTANHLEQLRGQLATTRDKLNSRPVPTMLAATHASALHEADAIEARLAQLQHRPPTP